MSDRPTPETDHLENNLKQSAKMSHPILWAHCFKLERERDEAREVLERIANLSMNARRVEADYAEWEKAVFAILDLCEERKEK